MLSGVLLSNATSLCRVHPPPPPHTPHKSDNFDSLLALDDRTRAMQGPRVHCQVVIEAPEQDGIPHAGLDLEVSWGTAGEVTSRAQGTCSNTSNTRVAPAVSR